MRKIVTSLVLITVLTGLTVAATRAFFSDSEVSNNNTFTAGALDLKIASNATYNGALFTAGTWSETDLTNEVFFDFGDIKPGDWGENTITYKVLDNDAWMCAKVVATDDDNGYTEPEGPLDLTVGANKGELGQFLTFIWWIDNGNNNLESGEQVLFGAPVTLAQMVGGTNGTGSKDFTIADSVFNIIDPIPSPVPGNTPRYLGLGWCLGTITRTNTGAGFTCDGTGVTDVVQSDKVVGSLSFTIEQQRNNPNFICPERRPTVTPE